MKIYFAYRSPYLPNHRHLKTFEADSILDWFQKNWHEFQDNNSLSDEKELQRQKNFFGVNVYGCWVDEDINAPQSYDELFDVINNKMNYLLETELSKDCIQVLTDDDEVDLVWYVFTEEYKNANMDKLAIWFYDKLPHRVNEKKPVTTTLELKDNIAKFDLDLDHNNSNLIYGLVVTSFNDFVYGSQGFVVKGTEVGTLFENVQRLTPIPDSYASYLLEVLKEVYQEEPYLPAQALWSRAMDFSLNSDEPEKKTIRHPANDENFPVHFYSNCNDHLVETYRSNFGEYYDYCVVFDKAWANQYPQLAKSILAFADGWKI